MIMSTSIGGTLVDLQDDRRFVVFVDVPTSHGKWPGEGGWEDASQSSGKPIVIAIGRGFDHPSDRRHEYQRAVKTHARLAAGWPRRHKASVETSEQDGEPYPSTYHLLPTSPISSTSSDDAFSAEQHSVRPEVALRHDSSLIRFRNPRPREVCLCRNSKHGKENRTRTNSWVRRQPSDGRSSKSAAPSAKMLWLVRTSTTLTC